MGSGGRCGFGLGFCSRRGFRGRRRNRRDRDVGVMVLIGVDGGSGLLGRGRRADEIGGSGVGRDVGAFAGMPSVAVAGVVPGDGVTLLNQVQTGVGRRVGDIDKP